MKTPPVASAAKPGRPVCRTLFSLLTFFCIFALPLTAAEVQTSPVPNEQARHSDDLGQSSTVLAIQVGSYEQLVAAIRQARAASRSRVEQAVRQEKVRECWETGKLIVEHVLQHKERADYGKRVMVRLSGDLGTSEEELYLMLRFYRAWPIVVPGQPLSWSHYKALLSVKDEKERKEIGEEAVAKQWSKEDLRRQIQKRNVGAGEMPVSGSVLTATPGKTGFYRVVRAKSGEYQGDLVIDLGFSNYYRPDKKLSANDREIVTFEKGKFKKAKEYEATLFTYKTDVVQVLDGDTFNAIVHLGLGFLTYQTLRLRGIDAPEILSPEGQEAKAFLEKRISGKSVLIKTTKSDKYDRYLVDIFVPRTGDQTLPAGRQGQATRDYTYVNQELLTQGYAVRVQS